MSALDGGKKAGGGAAYTDYAVANILVIDFEATAPGEGATITKQCQALGSRLGCRVTRQSYATLAAGIAATQWDAIIVPYITGVTAHYNNLNTFLGTLTTKCPVAVVAAMFPTVGSGAVSGALTLNATTQAWIISAQGEWRRPFGSHAIHSQPAATIASDVVPVLTDTSGNIQAWRKTLGGCPVLFIAGYAGSGGAAATVNKPHFAYQWVKDQNPAITYQAAQILLRWDSLDSNSTGMNTAFVGGALDTVYNAFSQFSGEMWVAAQYVAGTPLGQSFPSLCAWFKSRAKQNGGKFVFTNHQTDLYDGAGVQVSSDHVLKDQFAQGQTAWLADCATISRYGLKLGEDGNCKGVPVVLDGNDMDDPAAYFLSSQSRIAGGGSVGAWIWLSSTEVYPTLPITSQRSYLYNDWWQGARTITTSSGDLYAATDASMAQAANSDVCKQAIWGGSIYWHGTGFTTIAPVVDKIASHFLACPDIVKVGSWADAKAQFLRDIPYQPTL